MIVVEQNRISGRKAWKRFPLDRWSSFRWKTEEDAKRARSRRCLIVPTRGGGVIAAFERFDAYGDLRSFEEYSGSISPNEISRGKVITVLDQRTERLKIWVEAK